jgi:hypothetical protein
MGVKIQPLQTLSGSFESGLTAVATGMPVFAGTMGQRQE